MPAKNSRSLITDTLKHKLELYIYLAIFFLEIKPIKENIFLIRPKAHFSIDPRSLAENPNSTSYGTRGLFKLMLPITWFSNKVSKLSRHYHWTTFP